VKQDEFGRRLALHGMINSRLVNNEITKVVQEIPYLLNLEDKINQALNGKVQNPDDPSDEDTPPDDLMENLPF
jgi:hypothetical protein